MISIFAENCVYKRNGKSIRVLMMIDDACVFIDVNNDSAIPFVINQSKLDDEVSTGNIEAIEDPWLSLVNVIYSHSHPYIAKRDVNFERIKPLILNANFYKPIVRGAILDVLVEEGRGAKTTIYRYARRYWQRGQNINALIPDFKKCGGKGKKKTRNQKPLGRPNLLATVATTQMDDKLKGMMHSAILDTSLSGKTYLTKNQKPQQIFSLNKAYLNFLLMYCSGDPKLIDENRPSEASFRNYYKNGFSDVQKAQRKLGKKYFSANLRPLTSTVRANLIGPGQSYAIDSTPFDFGVTDDERLPLARPTLYVAVDDYSSVIAGVLLVLTPASYFNAVNCMGVAFGSKVELCKHFGMQISPDEWPVEGTPSAIFVDLGSEWKTADIEAMTTKYNIAIKNSGAGQPDKRPVGEQVFARIKAEMKHKIPGLVGAHVAKKAGGSDSQLDYTLMLDELNRELLKAVITLNHKPLDKWDSDADFPADLPKTPINIWKWGISNRTGLLPKIDRAQFWLSTLKREDATVTNDLLKIGKVQYRCPTFEGARLDTKIKNRKVQIVRDLDDASYIYLVPKEGESKFIKCELSPHDRRFKGMNWKDVESRLKIEKCASKQADTDYLKRAATDLVGTQKIVANAQAEKHALTEGLTIKERRKVLGNQALMRKESSSAYLFVKPATAAGAAENESLPIATTTANTKTKFFMDDED
jgi:hypothetical protein